MFWELSYNKRYAMIKVETLHCDCMHWTLMQSKLFLKLCIWTKIKQTYARDGMKKRWRHRETEWQRHQVRRIEWKCMPFPLVPACLLGLFRWWNRLWLATLRIMYCHGSSISLANDIKSVKLKFSKSIAQNNSANALTRPFPFDVLSEFDARWSTVSKLLKAFRIITVAQRF